MAPTMQTYTATLQLLVESKLPADAAFASAPVTVPCKKGTLTVAVSPGVTEWSSLIEIRWVFDHWFQESSGADIGDETSWQCWERSEVLFLPDEHGNVDFGAGMAVGEELFRACLHYFANLALASRSPHFWSCLRDTDLHELYGDIWVEVAGHKVPLKPRAWNPGPPAVRPKPVSLPQARALATTPCPRYATLLLTADRRFHEGSLADAIVHLAQGLEVAAYAYVRAKNVASLMNWTFGAPEMFGPPNLRHPDIQALNPQPLTRYGDICELFGARHDWIHEGQRKVRLFDPAKGKIPKTPTRRDLTREDYYTFRIAASEALTWMGYWPIE